MLRSWRFALSLVCIVLLTSAVVPAWADSTFWQDIPAGSQDWFDPVQWTAGVPTSSDEARIGTGPPAIISSGDAEAYLLSLYSKSDYGTGHIVHTGGSLTIGNVIYMISDLADAPTYQISGSASLSVGGGFYLRGEGGTPTFIQDGGTVAIKFLEMANYSGANGRYELRGGSLSTGTSLAYNYIEINNGGDGYFLQTGGTLTTPRLTFSSGTGTYEMVGGTLNVQRVCMNASGNNNLFYQTGGVAKFTDRMEMINGGTYHLSGGDLTSANVFLGWEGSARTPVFKQDGGAHATELLQALGEGKYELSGGTLRVNGAMELSGTLDFGNGPGTLNIGAGASGDLARGSILNPGQATVNIGAGGFLLLPQGFDPDATFGTWNNQGTAHIAGSTLVVPAGQTINFSGVIEDAVDVQGALVANTSRGIDLTGGLLISGSGVINTGEEGTIAISNQTSEIQGGQVSSKTFSLKGNSLFSQTGGTNTTGSFEFISDSLYELSGGLLSCTGHISRGIDGKEGNFKQTGGEVRVSGTINCGPYELIDGKVFTDIFEGNFIQSGGTVKARIAVGTYEISGGISEIDDIKGNVNQSGGQITAQGIHLSYYGQYELSGDGHLSADTISIGPYQNCKFTQSGESAVEVGELSISTFTGKVTAVYELNGGTITANSETVGTDTKTGDFIQTGGINNTDHLTVSALGTYQFSGGILNVSDGLALDGLMDFCGGNGIVNAGGLVNFSVAEVLNAGSADFNVLGSASTFIVPAGFDPIDVFGTYTNEGTLQFAGGMLFIPAGETYYAGGTVLAHVHAQGQFLSPSGQCDLKGGVTIEPDGLVDCGEGTVYINDETGIISGGELKAERVYVGNDSAGKVTQTGGRVTTTLSLLVGYSEGVSGTYILDGTGELVASGAGIGGGGNGTFRQLGGTFKIQSNTAGGLYVGNGGTYEQEDGLLSCKSLILDNGGVYIQRGGSSNSSYYHYMTDGTYELRGGILSTPWLRVSKPASLFLTGGTLDINGQADFAGALDCTGGTGTIDGRGWLDFGGAQILNAGGTTFKLAAGSLVILPAGFDPQMQFGVFDNQGVVYNLGSTLVVPAGKGFSGRDKVIYDPVNCAGYIHGTGSDGIELTGGLTVVDGADVNLGKGIVTLNGVDGEMTGGQLTSSKQDITDGKFTHTGGTNTATERLRLKSGSQYELSDSGTLIAEVEVIYGDLSEGVNQSGGACIVNDLLLNGGYRLSGGDLTANNLYICRSEIDSTYYNAKSGTFVHTGGECTVTDTLIVGWDRTSSGDMVGAYELSGTGHLSSGIVWMGGDGIFNQSGGLHQTTQMILAYYTQSNSTYELSSGELEAGLEYIGREGTGLFRQTGGANTVKHLIIGENGRYEWTGGTLNITGGSRIDGQFDFAETGKNLTIENAIVDISEGSFVNAGNAALTLGEGSLLIVSEGYNPADVFGSYNNAGLTHVAGTDLVIPTGKTVAGSGTINDPVLCQGTVAVTSGNELELPGGLQLFSGGRADILSGGASGYTTGLTTTDLNVGSDGTGTLNLQNTDANLVVSDSLKFGPGAMLSVTVGSGIHMTGSAFENTSIDPAALADMVNLTLIFEGGPGIVDPFEVAGEDMGPIFAGLESNFALGTLQLGGDDIGQIQLVDAFDNQPGWEGDEALYVKNLILGDGSYLDLNDFNLYYLNFTDYGGTIAGGAPTQIPEPATLGLLVLGACLALLKRRS